MRFSSDNSSFTDLPQFRCVWMTAGVLSYQLCDRAYDCDTCPLDQAMRTHFTRRHDAGVRKQPPLSKLPDPGEEFKYTRNHCWLQNIGTKDLRVGIEPLLASLLSSARDVVLPVVGQSLRGGQYTSWIIIDDDAYPLASPVAGTVLRTNKALSVNPHLIASDALSEGWLFDVEPTGNESRHHRWLMKKDAERGYASDYSRFIRSLDSALSPRQLHLGTTLLDGGEVRQDLVKIIGAQRYLKLLVEAFCPKRP